MTNLYKRYIFWSMGLYQKIPGFRRYGRFMERQYRQRFWTTVAWSGAIGLTVNIALRKLRNHLRAENAELQDRLQAITERQTRLAQMRAENDRLEEHLQEMKQTNRVTLDEMGEQLIESLGPDLVIPQNPDGSYDCDCGHHCHDAFNLYFHRRFDQPHRAHA